MKSIIYDYINVGKKQDKAIVMIHGWQGNKDSFKSISNLLKIDNSAWFFPQAPHSIDNNNLTNTWAVEVSPGVFEINKTKELLSDCFKDIIFKNFLPEDVYVIGFSQGAAVCYEFVLSLEEKLGGIFPIAGFMREEYCSDKVHRNQYSTPILIGHGKDDDIVLLESSQKAYTCLSKVCTNIKFDIYKGRHKINLSYLSKVKEIIMNSEKNGVNDL